MRWLVFFLSKIARISMAHPRLIITGFVVISIAGFAAMPMLTIGTDLVSGIGQKDSVVALTKENNDCFGEQDALIVVLEFPEPPGEARLPFIKGLADAVSEVPGVRRVRYQFLDPDNEQQTTVLFKQFLTGMNGTERAEILDIFSSQGIKAALKRNFNRLFLTYNPYLQEHILRDPLEIGQFAAKSFEKRVGSLSLGDVYLLMSSPDNTLFLIQITPQFPSYDMVRGKELVDKLLGLIPAKIASLIKTLPGTDDKFRDMKWQLTGKVMFQQESAEIFDRETATIVLFSFGLVLILLLSVYRSFWSTVLLMTPLAAGIGPNYGFMYLVCSEVNPVVMGATGVLLGLGTEYGEHLWGRIREELDRGSPLYPAVLTAYGQTGPPVLLGALTGVFAFLCLCLSSQPALIQFGYLGASGLVLTLLSTLLLVPALAVVASTRKKDYLPRIRVSFKFVATLFQARPGTIVVISALVILASLFFAARISYEKDLFKVFLARGMQSLSVSEKISRKFGSNFSQPTYLSFDADDLEKGLSVQRQLDGILEDQMERNGEIASFDSISYLESPKAVKEQNVGALSKVLQSWPQLEDVFKQELGRSNLSARAFGTMEKSFNAMHAILASLNAAPSRELHSDFADLERSWYMAKIRGAFRFLTRIRYSDKITDPDELKKPDARIMDATKGLPLHVSISGTRQAMEEILSNLVAELARLGIYAFACVVLIFFAVFPSPRGVGLSLIPMIGAFCITLGVLGATGMGVPFSIVCVAPLIFGFGIHNGIHVVMGSLFEEGHSIANATMRVTPRAMVTSSTIIMGFVAMLTSRHYSLEFLGLALVIGMVAAVPLTLITLPALLLLIEKPRASTSIHPTM
jgi:predicted RND superfamily exporter protein